MKKILLLLLICFILFSCKKDDATPSGTDASGSVQYKVNGNLVVMDNIDILTGQYVMFAKQLKSVLLETRYLLNAQKGANNFFVLTLVTDSLLEMNYHYDSTYAINNVVTFIAGALFNGQQSTLYFNGDYLDVNISSYRNSRISGTFTAKLTPISFDPELGYPNRGTTIITEGKINNVQVIY